MPSKGHPIITVRLHPEAIRRMKQRAEARGISVAGFIRALVYQEIDFPGSEEWEALQEEEGGSAPSGR